MSRRLANRQHASRCSNLPPAAAPELAPARTAAHLRHLSVFRMSPHICLSPCMLRMSPMKADAPDRASRCILTPGKLPAVCEPAGAAAWRGGRA